MKQPNPIKQAIYDVFAAYQTDVNLAVLADIVDDLEDLIERESANAFSRGVNAAQETLRSN